MTIPSTFQTQMNVHEGLKAGLGANGQIPLMQWYPRIVAKTAAYTVLASESGSIFTTTAAGGSVTFTLPAISTGPWIYRFLCGAAQTTVVAAETLDTAVGFNDLDLDSVSFAQASEKIGGEILAICDGTTLFLLPRLASAAQTVTFTD